MTSGDLQGVLRSEFRTYCDFELLKVRAVGSGGLQAIGSELSRDILGGALEFGSAVAPPLQIIGGQKGNVLLIPFRREFADREGR